LRFWLSSFLLSLACFFSIGKRKKIQCKKEQGCDNTYSINIWKRQQVDSINSENTIVEPTKQKLYYPIERTRAWSEWLNTYIYK
jgi:hypothetical protein